MQTKTIVIGVLALCALLAAAVVASCAGVMYFSFRDLNTNLAPAIDEFFAETEGDSFEKTYDTLMADEYRAAATRKQHEQMGRTVRIRLGRLKTKSMQQFQVRSTPSGTYANVVYSATFEKGTGQISAQLRKVGDKWLIVGIRLNSNEMQKGMVVSTCPHCNEPLTENVKFCPKCGKPQAKEEEKAEEDEEEMAEAK